MCCQKAKGMLPTAIWVLTSPRPQLHSWRSMQRPQTMLHLQQSTRERPCKQ
jgi:hypothetical protein